MQLDKQKIRHAFSRAATSYDEVAVLQQRMLDELVDRLDLVQLQPASILDIGCGTGYGVNTLSRRYPQAHIYALDLAEGMLTYARSHSGCGESTSWICGDAELLPLKADSVDLAVCSATLQWCEMTSVFAECARVLRTEGLLTFTSFGPDTLLELKQAWRDVDDEVHVHDFVDMHNVGDALVQAGFAAPVLDVEKVQLTYADPKQALNEVRMLGSTNAASGRPRGLLGKGRYQQLLRALAVRQQSDGRLPITFECVYGHAFAPSAMTQKRLADGSVSIPLGPSLKR